MSAGVHRKHHATSMARLAISPGLPLLLGLSLGLTLGACEGEQGSVGTNTNWMLSCDESADCDDEDACICERCTRSCVSDEDCPEDTLCAPESAARLQCGGDDLRTCQPSCESDSDCSDGRVCHQGVCADALASACPAEALVCEDFEEDLGAHLPVVTPGNALERVETPSPSGSFALQATVTDAPSVAYLRADPPVQSSGELFLSGWVSVPEEEEHDMAPLGFWTATEEDWALRTVIRNGQLELWSYTSPLAGPYDLVTPGWHCLELRVTLGDAPNGSVEVSVDGVSAMSATEVDTLPTGGIKSLTMGTLWAGTTGTMRVDRVILGTEATSCYGN